MRVTSQSLSTQIIEDMQQAYQRLASAQEVATTGLKINSLSDDPRGATQALGLLSFQSSLDQYQRNINSAQPLLQQQDSVLGDVVNGLTQAKQIALQAANSINTPAEQQAAAAQIQQIFSQLLADANTSVGNRFLFGGFLSGAAPFAQGANGVSYLGDNGNVTIQTSPTSSLSTNLPGSQVFQGAGVDGGVGIFDVLQDLQTILQGNGASNALNLAVNLDSRIAAGSGFSPPDAVGTEATPGTFTGEANYSTTVTVFDSQGQAHNLTLLFAKTGAATFKYRVLADSNEITGGTPGDLYQVAPEGTLAFNPDGTLNAGASTLTDITLTNLADGASDINIAGSNVGFTGSTQLAQASAFLSLTQTNANGIQAQLGRLDAAISQISTFQAQVGARENSAQAASTAVGLLKDNTTAQRSQIQDADALTAFSDLARFQTAFQAAIQSGATVLQQPSLLYFLQ